MDAAESPSIAAPTADRFSERTNHASEFTNSNAQEKRTSSTGLEHSCEAIQNLPSFDFIWTIEGFSLLPKLGRHFSETFDAMNLTWGLFLVPWLRRDRRHLSLTLYPEDGSRDVEKLGDLRVSYRITLFNQGCGEDKVYRDTVDGVFARRLDRKLQSIQLVSLDIFLDPSYGFLVDDTCAFGVEILDVARTRRRRLPASDTGPFRWTIQGLSKKPPFIFEKFGACGYDWIIFALVGRSHSLGSEGLHIYVGLSSSHILCQLFGRFRIRLINQLTGNHIDKSYCGIFHSGKFHGCAGVVPLRVFHDEEAGFLIKGCCVVEVEVTVLSKRPEHQVMNFYLGAGETGLTIQEENAYHNPFAWDMSPYWRILKKNPGFDITDLLLKHRYTSLDGHPLH